MATLSIRIPDHLKEKVASVASQQGVSMNNFITSCLSSAVAQEITRSYLAERLKKVDLDKTKFAFDKIMSKSRTGPTPPMRKINELIQQKQPSRKLTRDYLEAGDE